MSYRGKTVLVIGDGKDVGVDHARRLAGEGASLALHYNTPSSREQTLKLRDELSKRGNAVSVHTGDLSTASAVERLFSQVRAEHKHIDIVINTAGMMLNQPKLGGSGAEYEKMLAYAVFVDGQRRKWTDTYQDSVRRLHSAA